MTTHEREHELLGSEAKLELDDDRFAYAGKFRVPGGKAVTRDGDEIVAALSFSPDHADDEAVRVRYIAVRADRRGEGIGSDLLGFTAERLLESGYGYERVRISVNNPYSYMAARKAGFGWTGEETGLAELVMERPHDGDERHQEALRTFSGRDLSDEEEEFVRRKLDEAREG